MSRLTALPILILLPLLLAACGGEGGGLGQPTPLMSRMLDQPYEWDAPLAEDDWEAWLQQQPQPDRPLRIVASTPEVWTIVKYTGREAIESLYPVMPFPEPAAWQAGQAVRVTATGQTGTLEGEPKGTTVEVTIGGSKQTINRSELELVLPGRVYETFDVASVQGDPESANGPAPASRKEQALKKLQEADLVVCAGAGVDDWMDALIQESGTRASVLKLGDRLNYLMTQRPVTAPEGHPRARNGVIYATDPNNFWWLNLRPASVAVDSLDVLLGHMVPGMKSEISGWREKWLEELGGLDQAMASFMLDDPKLDANSVIPRRVLIDTPALAWFCQRWDLTIVDIINTDGYKAPSPERIREIKRKAQEQHVSFIITTAGYRNTAVEEIANGLTVEIMEPDPKVGDQPAPFNPNKKAKRIPVPVVEIPLGVGQAGEDTMDYVPFLLYATQHMARTYKPVIDGLYTLKKWHEDRGKQQSQPAPAPEEPAAQ